MILVQRLWTTSIAFSKENCPLKEGYLAFSLTILCQLGVDITDLVNVGKSEADLSHQSQKALNLVLNGTSIRRGLARPEIASC
jgi:hypothetical protein